MSITRLDPSRRITRRSALRALGVSLALPWLDAVAGRVALGAPPPASKPPVRLGFVFVPNGVHVDAWRMMRAQTSLSPTLAPLEKVKRDVLILSNLCLEQAKPRGDGPGDHARSAAAFLTTAHPRKTEGRDIRLGVSVDQVAAKAIGDRTPLPSLEMGCDRGRGAGSCDSGYSCAYSTNISWSGETTPVPKEVDPRAVFERLFGAEEDGAEPAASAARLKERRSVLDLVLDESRRLAKELGRADRQKLDEYQTSVREVERRIQTAEKEARARPRPEAKRPDGIPADYREHLRLLYDLMTLAFQTDATRVATLMAAAEGSNRTYPSIEVTDGHHQLSHHGGDARMIEQVKRIDRFHVEELARFVERLGAIPEGKGRLIDRCAIVYGSGIADGNRHDHDDLPIVLVGKAGGTISTGRYAPAPRGTPLANLYLSLLRRAGVAAERFGDSTGELKELTA
jgi:hypothetical protein